jgi:ubiquinone/menaquinone biosynthesis C-methylase UbiE
LPTASSLTTFLKNNLLKFLQVYYFQQRAKDETQCGQGWNVNAFDQSIEGKRRKLANKHDVAINYEVGEFQSIGYQENQFDAIALIYAHFPADKNQVITKY